MSCSLKFWIICHMIRLFLIKTLNNTKSFQKSISIQHSKFSRISIKIRQSKPVLSCIRKVKLRSLEKKVSFLSWIEWPKILPLKSTKKDKVVKIYSFLPFSITTCSKLLEIFQTHILLWAILINFFHQYLVLELQSFRAKAKKVIRNKTLVPT